MGTDRTGNGFIKVIVGCMYSGKSSEAVEIARREQISKLRKVQVFIPKKARRNVALDGKAVETVSQLVSRNGKTIGAIEFDENQPEQILELLAQGTTTVVIEEAHFCAASLVGICKKMAEELQLNVIVTGLDQTFTGDGFGPIPALMVEADFVEKKRAVCMECGSQNASKSWLKPEARSNVENGRVLVGDEQYMAVCRHCYNNLVQKYGLPT